MLRKATFSKMVAGSSMRPEFQLQTRRHNCSSAYIVSTYLTRTQIQDSIGAAENISFWDLPKFIKIAEKAGLPAKQYRLQYQTLLSRPPMDDCHGDACCDLLLAVVSIRKCAENDLLWTDGWFRFLCFCPNVEKYGAIRPHFDNTCGLGASRYCMFARD